MSNENSPIGSTGSPAAGLAWTLPMIDACPWEDGERIVTVGGKPVGCTLSHRDAEMVAAWLRTAIREIMAGPIPEPGAALSAPSTAPAALREACLTMLIDFENWNSPMMTAEPKENKWMRFYASLQAVRELSTADPSQAVKGGEK